MMRTFSFLKRIQEAMGKDYKVSMSVEPDHKHFKNYSIEINRNRSAIVFQQRFNQEMVTNGSSLSSHIETEIIKKAKKVLGK